MTFKKLATYFQQLEVTSSRLKITDILAELFKEALEEEIDKIIYLSLGELLPPYEGLEFQMAEKMVARAIARATSSDLQEVQKEYKKNGDLGTTAEKLKKETKEKNTLWDMGGVRSVGEMGVVAVYDRLLEIARESGAGSVEKKIDKLAVLLEDLDPLSVRYVVRIPLGKLRLGFSELTILDALSVMIAGDKSLRAVLEESYNVVADVGEIGRSIKSIRGIRSIKEIKPKVGTPIVAALAQRLGTVEEMLEKMGTVAVEPKYDGERLQLHKDHEKIKIFTRNLENVTHMFPEIVEALKKEVKAESVIFDSEGVGIDAKTGKHLPFQETIKRKRKHGIAEAVKEIPIKAFVFDILYKDGESLIGKPLFERRKILEKILEKKANTLVLSPQIVSNNPAEIRKFHEEQKKMGLEGAMVKKENGIYQPGRRGFNWVKYKQEETKKGGGLADTIEAIVMGVTVGKGKRAEFGVGTFLVGVRKGEKFVTVTNIGTGLSDEQFKELKVKSSKFKVKEKPESYEVDKNHFPDEWVKPGIVVEIQADNLTESPTHSAGLAMRFPRLVRFREDKPPEKITTLEEVRELYDLQFK